MKPYYDQDGITLYLGDCREVLPQITEKVDLVLTSPPYDDLRTYGCHGWDFKQTADNLPRVLNDGAFVVWVVGDQVVDGSETGSSFEQALYLKSIGLRLHDTMIYGKNGNPNSESVRYNQMFEYMFVFCNGKPTKFNPIKQASLYYTGKSKYHTRRQRNGDTEGGMYFINPDRNLDNIWIYDIGYMKSAKGDYIFKHPAIFPEQLALDHITTWTNPGDLVLDCFLGSGTTAFAAKKLGRRCIGIEINEDYLKIAIERLRQSVMNLTV